MMLSALPEGLKSEVLANRADSTVEILFFASSLVTSPEG